jgi:hypothetical protein
MITRFLIFSLARSGSTTLMHQLNCHPEIRCRLEPFNPGLRTYRSASDCASLDQALEEIWTSYNGFKHVWDTDGWPFGTNEELNKHLLRKREYRVLFLNRRNTLRRLVSCHISHQVNVWDTSDAARLKLAEFKFRPINIEWLRRNLQSEKQTISTYRQVMVGSGVDFLDLWYEDLFDMADENSRTKSLNRVITFLGGEPIADGRVRSLVNELFDPKKTQLNSAVTYSKIPNVDDIERQLGADDTGWLFRTAHEVGQGCL